MRTSFAEALQRREGTTDLSRSIGASWSSRLTSFAELCEEKAADADERSNVHPDIAVALRTFGILTTPLPWQAGGAGLAEASNWSKLLYALRTIGAADLSIGRLYEGHANAIDLVHRYGSDSQFQALAHAIGNGAMTGVWGADGKNPLQLSKVSDGWLLQGGKILASGAGLVTKPLVTAGSEDGQRLILLTLEPGERADLSSWTPLGMRSSATGSVDLTGMVLSEACLIGEPGDFTRQPYFSGGAWRFCAVHLGGMQRLVDLYREQLLLRRRGDDPYQLQRVAACVAAAGTAAFWIRAAARQLALRSTEAEKSVALSNLARGITERAALDIMETVQRGSGLPSFIQPSPLERIARDLSTYLRQPMPDLAMADAARWVLANAAPIKDIWNFDEDPFLS